MKNPLMQYGLFGWNYWHLITHPWLIIEESYYHIKWFIQRGYRGYSDSDSWGLDSYLCSWLPQAIRSLKDSHGHPVGMTPWGWNTRLEKMAQGFEAMQNLADLKFTYKSPEERIAWRQFHRGMKLFHKHFFSLWD